MKADRRVQGGMRLVAVLLGLAMLAGCGKSTVVRSPSAAPAGVATTPSKGVAGKSVVVQRGDTLYSLARAQGVGVGDLVRWNGLQPPYTIYPGQRLQLGEQAGRSTATTTTARPASTPAPATTPAPRPAVTTAPAAPATSGFSWRWPAQGVLLDTFVAGNNTRQGIDIGGSSGQPVVAAADGVVVYSGAGLVGYGELIIVKHNDQWLSAYGHNRARLVNEGQNVKGGQQIAEMGRTGAARDMLHFEIRYNGKPVDPLLYLPKR
jgi:lipoprotein NlpD